MRTPANPLLPPFITTVVAFLVYFFTLEPDLTWANYGGDGGELITAAVTLGVPHPPGYPIYVIVGKLFSFLPVGTVAFRFNLLSALGTAVAAGFVAGIVYRLRPAINGRATGERPINRAGEGGFFRGFVPAVAAGMAFAFAPLVWGQGVIAEVYALNLVFVGAFLFFLLSSSVGAGLVPALGDHMGNQEGDHKGNQEGDRKGNQEGDHKGRPYIIGLLLGLSITTHLTSVMLLPLALLLMPVRGWGRLLGGVLGGLLPFLLLPLLAQSGSPVVWGRPDTPAGWWWVVSAQLYRPNVLGLPASEWPVRLAEWGRLFLEQFAYAGLPLGLVGFFGRFKTYPRLLTGLAATALLYIVYAFTYNTFDAAVLLLPALFLLSVILAFGLQHLGRAAIILPLALLWLNLSQPEPGYWTNMTVNQTAPVRPAADTLLTSVPAEAILLTPGDPTLTALWYFHHVEEKRPDIIIIDGNLFQFTWYREQLGRDYPFLRHLAQDDLPGFIVQNRQSRPLCEVSLVPPGYFEC